MSSDIVSKSKGNCIPLFWPSVVLPCKVREREQVIQDLFTKSEFTCMLVVKDRVELTVGNYSDHSWRYIKVGHLVNRRLDTDRVESISH